MYSHTASLGAGEKAFCAGGDVRAVVETVGQPDALGEYFFRDEYILNCLIGTLHIPYIALIDGKFNLGDFSVQQFELFLGN